jgi:SAM-dependent methyltransferase
VPPTLSAEQIREVNTRYHDVAADHYDAKWGIDFGPVGREQVLAKVDKALGHDPDGWARSLEIGAGTGYFTLNLMRAGKIAHATCTDISPGMLQMLRANAERLELDVRTEHVDAERLPFDDASFDLVLGHAVLHHIPDLARAFGEFQRVLAPGGTVLFAGEPSRYGDRLARMPKRAAVALFARAPLPPTPARRPTWGSRVSSTCTPSRPASLRGPPTMLAWSTYGSPARSCSPAGSAGPTAPSRRAPRPTTCRGPGGSTPTADT